jgi:hypothetical protein
MVVQTVGQESALTESLRTPRVNLLREEMYDDENELLVSAGCQQKNGSDILRTEWAYLVPLTGSPPSRVPHWARSMQWRRRRRRSSIVCWSSWLRAVNRCEYCECCFRCSCCRTKCVVLVLDSDRSRGRQSIYSPSNERPSDPPGCDDQQNTTPGFSLNSASCVKEIGSKLTADTRGRKREPFETLGLGYEQRFGRIPAHE